MSSVKALKRKSQKNLNNKEKVKSAGLIKTSSYPNLLSVANGSNEKLRKCKSESDLSSVHKEFRRPQKFEAKSERNLNSIYNFTSSPSSTFTSTPTNAIRNKINHTSTNTNQLNTPTNQIRNISSIMEESNYSLITDNETIKIPIIGFEIMEERSRFTIFKLRIENYEKNNFWLVLRRFTDFTRLHNKLKLLFPDSNLVLPKKKWFGNNFSSGFLDTRVAGLQTFINTILGNSEMKKCQAVREFFCLDEPPLFSESMEDCKVIFEAQEETIAHLKMQLKAKDEIITNLSQSLHIQQQQNNYLTSLVK